MEIKEIGSFQDHYQETNDNPELQKGLDQIFGEDNDCIAIVGIGYIGQHKTAIARMILPKAPNTDWRPKRMEIKIGFDGENQYFTIFGKDPDVGVVLACEFVDSTVEFIDAAKQANGFIVEIISPNEHHKVLCKWETGEVIRWNQFELPQIEYEKHLGGMYCEDKIYPKTVRVKENGQEEN